MEGDTKYLAFRTLKFDDLKITIDRDEFRSLHLQYRGEGNDNIVLHIPKIPFVFRFKKSECPVNKRERNANNMIEFSFCYMFLDLFFKNYFSTPIFAEIADEDIKEIDLSIYHSRPKTRRHKRLYHNGFEIYPDYSLLPSLEKLIKTTNTFDIATASTSPSPCLKNVLSNVFLERRDFIFYVMKNPSIREQLSNVFNSSKPSLCIEIKPKQGWTALPDRKSLCAFCINQYLKLNTGKIQDKSDYCPLDLFSGNIVRMKAAVIALLLKPQNNLRIFQNGLLIYGEEKSHNLETVLSEWFKKDESKNSEIFSDLIIKALLSEPIVQNDIDLMRISCKPYSKSRHYNACPNINLSIVDFCLSKFSCIMDSTLPENCVLNRILTMQKLDDCGLETVYDYYKTHGEEFDSEFGYVEKMISNSKINSSGEIQCVEINVVDAYLLSTLAKDLSILITLKPINPGTDADSFTIEDQTGNAYEVNVSVVDVGPKSTKMIEKHWKRERDWMTACAKYLCPEALN